MSTPGPGDDLDALAATLAEMRSRLAPVVLARQERRRAGATPGERLSTPQHLTLLAPGEKLRVVLNVGDQREHFLRAVPEQNGLVNRFHTIRLIVLA